MQVIYSFTVHITFHTKDNNTSRIAVWKMSLTKCDAHHEIYALGLKCPFNHVLYHKNSKVSHLYQKQPHNQNALFSQSFDYKCKDIH